jgi:hypothetical protein
MIHDFQELLAATDSTIDSGVAVTYPFTLEEFWAAVERFDVQVQHRIEEAAGREDRC